MTKIDFQDSYSDITFEVTIEELEEADDIFVVFCTKEYELSELYTKAAQINMFSALASQAYLQTFEVANGLHAVSVCYIQPLQDNPKRVEVKLSGFAHYINHCLP